MAKKSTKGAEKLLARISEWFSAHPKDSYNYLQISQELGIFGRSNRSDVYDMLVELQAEGFLREISSGRYTLADRKAQEELIGIFDRRHNGMHNVRITATKEDGVTPLYEEPFTVYDGDDLQALSGDKVRIQKMAGKRTKFGGPQARVVEVIERVPHRYVGVLQKTAKYAFVTPDNRALDKDIYIPNELLGKAKNGDKVVVDFERWPQFSKNPVGRIADVLGRDGENNAEMHAILAEYGLPYKYPESLVRVANKIADGVTDEEVARRLDYRPYITFTIDPAEREAFEKYAKPLVEGSVKEEQCTGYDYFFSITKAGEGLLFEDWPSQEALDFHMQTPHFLENYPEHIKAMYKSSNEDRIYK